MESDGDNFFVCIGAQKSGTTWLYSFLQSHPDVNLPAIKELHIFDQIFNPEISGWLSQHYKGLLGTLEKNAGKSAVATERYETMLEMTRIPELTNNQQIIDSYRSLILKSKNKSHIISGEITPCYALLPRDGIQTILTAFPNAKFIILLRDPVDRYWSQLWHQKRFDPEFEPEKNFVDHLSKPGFGERSLYDQLINKYKSVVSLENIHVSFYEDLFQNKRQSELNKITDFLGISSKIGQLDEIEYSNNKAELPRDLREIAQTFFKSVYSYDYPNGPVPDCWLNGN